MLSRISLEDGKEGGRERNKRLRDGERGKKRGKGKERDGGGSRGTVSKGFIPG